ncbi:glutamyl-tRNA reductase [Saccharobesus litoralis]|uniref:Glutamyl-tRNA reductase n=1 Tax=Saccharobesus litoralis TaxID=2172099 RepID=A0A2S0VU08_9ALTE|nr:glutamyl-tRNA reductase [Saccharobesus litoralis]AWB67701.1 glutamyl-tRNA reductase [Saccharobesus litoralis]
MAFYSFGVSHKTAPVSIREKVAFSTEELDKAIADLKNTYQVDEVVSVNTCNRTEVYVVAKELAHQQVVNWFAYHSNVESKQLADSIYFHAHQQAVSHLMEVAAGLDSLVLGEPQILGQLKQAYSEAKNRDYLGQLLQKLFQKTFSVAKDIRTNTEIGASAVSVAFAAVNLAKHIFSDLAKSQVLLVGAGETIELVARHLKEAGCTNIVVANRTLERAKSLADEFSAQCATLNEIPELLVKSDVVVASTASPLPIIGKGMVEKALKKRLYQPMLMIDIAVPRDIEEEVNTIDNVYLYTVDDLQGIVEKNQQQRQKAAQQAKTIINTQVKEFYEWLDSLKSVDYVREYRQQCEALKQTSLDKALKQLSQGADAEQVLKAFANQLTSKLMHAPTLAIREAVKSDKNEFIELMTEQSSSRAK